MKNKWTDKEIDFLKQYYYNLPNKKIGIILNRTEMSIKRKGQSLNLLKNRSITMMGNSNKKCYYFDKNYFNIPTLENCYWAGFIAADGCLRKEKGYYAVSINLCSKDRIILEEFQKVTNYQGKIIDQKSINKSSIKIGGAYQWHKMLNKHWNITPKKSNTLMSPKSHIGKDLALAFIIGLSDGDGGAKYFLDKRLGYKYLRWYIAGTYSMMFWVKNKIEKFCSLEDTNVNIRKHSLGEKTYVLEYTGKGAQTILEDLLTIQVSFRLSRKWSNTLYRLDL